MVPGDGTELERIFFFFFFGDGIRLTYTMLTNVHVYRDCPSDVVFFFVVFFFVFFFFFFFFDRRSSQRPSPIFISKIPSAVNPVSRARGRSLGPPG